MTLVIMAAGMGSRFGGLKQIEPINNNGEFIIDYSIFDAIKTGFNKVVIIIKKENYEIFKNTIGKRIENQTNVEYVFQELDNLPENFTCPKDRIKPWGTGHAILCVKDVIKEPFVIINADDFYGRESYEVVANFLKNIGSNTNKMQAAMVGYKLINTVSENGSVKRGVCKEKEGKLIELIESKIEKENDKYIAYPIEEHAPFEVSKDALVSMNMFVFTNEIFSYLEKSFIKFLEKNINDLTKEFLIPNFVFELINKDLIEVTVLKTNSKWLGITYKEDKENVVNEIKKMHEQKIYDDKLWNS